jgi:hypothetical protein
MRSPLERYTLYQQIYERFSSPTRPRGQNGRILRHSHAMNGSAGLFPSRNRKPESSTLSVYARSSRKECAGLVAGLAVLTAEMRLTRLYCRCRSPRNCRLALLARISHCAPRVAWTLASGIVSRAEASLTIRGRGRRQFTVTHRSTSCISSPIRTGTGHSAQPWQLSAVAHSGGHLH